MKKVTDLKENEVIHCPTKEEFGAILKLNPRNNCESHYWDNYRESTYYRPYLGGYFGDVRKNTRFTVYPASDFMQPSYLQLLDEAKELAKQEGMRVEFTVETDWEVVEFVECIKEGKIVSKGRVYKVLRFIDWYNETGISIHDDRVSFVNMSEKHFKPSTETAYVEQLKKEAFERFGEIKHLDNFIAPDGKNQYQIPSNKGFRYTKGNDTLCFSGIHIYDKGKWAKRVAQSFFEEALKEENEKLKKDIDLIKSILKNYE